MLSLGFKQGEKLNIYELLKRTMDELYGPQLSSQIDAPLKNFQHIRDELLNIPAHRSDSNALSSLIGDAKIYVSMWATICNSFSFGKDKVKLHLELLGEPKHDVRMVRLIYPGKEDLGQPTVGTSGRPLQPRGHVLPTGTSPSHTHRVGSESLHVRRRQVQ